jgi:serralysin
LLEIDQPISGSTSFAAQLVGVQLYDTIDLTDLPFVSGANYTLPMSPSELIVTSGSNSETFSLLSDTVTKFSVADDGNGGTDVTAIPLNYVYFKVKAEATLIVPNGTSAVLDVTANSGATATAGNGAPSTFLVAATKIASPLSNAVGDPGNTLNGADSGMDTFVFSGNFGQNTITNFATSPGNHDTLELSKAQFGDLATMIQNGDIQQVGHNTLITDPLNSADTIKLMGVSALELESHPNNFHFVCRFPENKVRLEVCNRR